MRSPRMIAGMKLIQAFQRWLARRRTLARTRRELHALPDHLLKDLGLRRDAIDEVFRVGSR